MTLLAAAVLAATFTRSMERVNATDPIKAQSVYDSHVVQLLYRTPLEIDYKARPYKLIPGLCELPEVSDDGLRYVFRMRGESAFAMATAGKRGTGKRGTGNGERGADVGSRPSNVGVSPAAPQPAVTAHDIVRCLTRLKDPANASPGGWTMKLVKSMRAADDATVEIELSSRSHVFPWMMAMSYAAVIAPDGSETGPFRLKSWRRNHAMTFERRVPEPGLFDTVRYLVVGDVSTQWLMFLKGEVDYLSEIPRDNWDAVVDAEGRLIPSLAAEGVRLYASPSMEVAYYGFNMRDPVLGPNKKLRQALTCAFDFPAWRRFQRNRVEEANGPVPPGVAGRLESPPRYRFDLERAKSLLAEAGYPGGTDPATGKRLVITLSMGRATPEVREAGELLASFFDRIGVKLELAPSTWTVFLQAVNDGRVQMYTMGWVGDYPDAENFLQLFHSKNVSPGPNHSFYASADFDREFDAAMAEGDDERRNVHWRACQEILQEDCPWIFASFPKKFTLMRPTVGNYVPSDFPYGEEAYFTVEEGK